MNSSPASDASHCEAIRLILVFEKGDATMLVHEWRREFNLFHVWGVSIQQIFEDLTTSC